MFNECKINMETADPFRFEFFYGARHILRSFITAILVNSDLNKIGSEKGFESKKWSK